MSTQAIKKGKCSFLINIRDTQNATWQGSITWVEGQRTEYFRSVLELLRLMDSAVGKDKEPEADSNKDMSAGGRQE
ncbi:MAG: hypothetical protein U0L49_03190 [Eubacterium sp.]|nr:hypothetical protein [Eubacterium sp.]